MNPLLDESVMLTSPRPNVA